MGNSYVFHAPVVASVIVLIWGKMLSHTRMGVPYEYTHMGHPIRVWADIRIWGRTAIPKTLEYNVCMRVQVQFSTLHVFPSSALTIIHQQTGRRGNAARCLDIRKSTLTK